MNLSYQDKFKKTLFAFALAITLFGGIGTFLTIDADKLAVAPAEHTLGIQFAGGGGSAGSAGIGTGSI